MINAAKKKLCVISKRLALIPILTAQLTPVAYGQDKSVETICANDTRLTWEFEQAIIFKMHYGYKERLVGKEIKFSYLTSNEEYKFTFDDKDFLDLRAAVARANEQFGTKLIEMTNELVGGTTYTYWAIKSPNGISVDPDASAISVLRPKRLIQPVRPDYNILGANVVPFEYGWIATCVVFYR